jgi:hypothetical protein
MIPMKRNIFPCCILWEGERKQSTTHDERERESLRDREKIIAYLV